MKKNHTIADIAQLSGVSKGTVDRVLHNRGKVSKEAKVAVEKVLKEINYRPNVMARNLKRAKTYTIALFSPDPISDPYWMETNGVVREIIEDKGSLGIDIKPYYFDPFEAQSFIEKIESFDSDNVDLVILSSIYYNESLFFIQQLRTKEIPYIVFNSTTEISGALSFIGQDLKQSGRLAGHLMRMLSKGTGIIACFHLMEPFENTVHMKKKQIGVQQYFKDFTQEYKVENINIIADSKQEYLQSINDYLIELNPVAAYVSNSKANLVAEALALTNLKIPLIAYDKTEENLDYLKKGAIDFIIQQNPRKQLLKAFHMAVDFLVFQNTVKATLNFPLDIISKENY
ncbi:MAG: substrate-binding domain-containing protein [Flavobacteriaceae bacterium]